MGKALALILAVLGAVAALVLAMPGLVIVGAMALVIPGLILGAAPTAFLWVLVFAIAWRLCRLALGEVASIPPALIVAAVAIAAAPLPSADTSRAHLDAVLVSAADVMPDGRIALAGNLLLSVPRLDRQPFSAKAPAPKQEERDRQPWVCNALCAALLATPGVGSVTVDAHGDSPGSGALTAHARSFRLVPKDQCRQQTIRPANPDGLDIDRPRNEPGAGLSTFGSLSAEWNLRLSTTDCIVMEPPRDRYDLTLAVYDFRDGSDGDGRWSLRPLPVDVDRFVVADGTGKVLLRRTIASTRALSRPLFVDATGGMENFRFEWGRSRLSNAGRSETLRPAALLQANSDLAVGGDRRRLDAAIGLRLAEILDDPDLPANDPAFALVQPWLYGFDAKGARLDAGDRELLLRIVAEPRITEYGGLHIPVRALGEDSALLRAAIGHRLAAADPPAPWMKTLAAQYLAMPAGTFRAATADEERILADPPRRLYAGGLIVRQADGGRAAVPLLVEILGTHFDRLLTQTKNRNNDDRLAIDAARRALCRLGPEAAAALPQIEALRESGRIPRAALDRDDWPLVLARLGKPVAEIDKPTGLSGTDEQFRSNLLRRLAKFDPDRNCGAQWL